LPILNITTWERNIVIDPPFLYVEFNILHSIPNTSQVETQVLSQINYARNRNAKRLQAFNGILLLVNGTTQTVLDYASRLCLTPSYNNIFDILGGLSEGDARKVKVISRDPERGPDLTFDNIQTYAKQWKARSLGDRRGIRDPASPTLVHMSERSGIWVLVATAVQTHLLFLGAVCWVHDTMIGSSGNHPQCDGKRSGLDFV